MAGEKEEKRHIARIQIRDVLAIESLDLDVGENGLKISGRTGSGKTSILDSLSAAFGRSARAEMVRKGTERGELLVVLDDGVTISRDVTADGLSSPTVRDPAGKAIKRPADYLSKIMPGLGLNPVEFINANEDKQVRMLADAFPVKVTLDELRVLAGPAVDLDDLAPKEGQLSGLELAMAATRLVKSKLSEKTTLIKRADSQREALVAQVPPGFNPDDVRGVSTVDLANELTQISQHNRVVSDTQRKLAAVTKTMGEGQNKIDQAKAEIERLQQMLKGYETRMEELTVERDGLQTWIGSHPAVETVGLEMRLQTLDEQRVILGHYDRSRELEKEVNDLKEDSAGLKAAKERLESFPAQLTRKANIAIDGLTIEDERILIGGLPVKNLSDGERLRLAVQIAAAGSGDLGFICVDGAERLSEDVREDLLSQLEARGIQFFLTEVSNEDLTIAQRRQPPARKAEQVAEQVVEPVPEVSAEPVVAAVEPALESVSPDEPRAAEPAVEERTFAQLTEDLGESVKAAQVVEGAKGELLPAAEDAKPKADWALELGEPVVNEDDLGLGVFAEKGTVAAPAAAEADWAAYRDKVEAEEALHAQEDVPDLDDDIPDFDQAVPELAAEVVQSKPAQPVYASVPDFGFD